MDENRADEILSRLNGTASGRVSLKPYYSEDQVKTALLKYLSEEMTRDIMKELKEHAYILPDDKAVGLTKVCDNLGSGIIDQILEMRELIEKMARRYIIDRMDIESRLKLLAKDEIPNFVITLVRAIGSEGPDGEREQAVIYLIDEVNRLLEFLNMSNELIELQVTIKDKFHDLPIEIADELVDQMGDEEHPDEQLFGLLNAFTKLLHEEGLTELNNLNDIPPWLWLYVVSLVRSTPELDPYNDLTDRRNIATRKK